VLAIAAISLYSLDVNRESVENHGFDAWKLKHNKHYSAQEEAFRMNVWLDNFAYVESHNRRYEAGLETYNL
jgi:hypothetical protein